MEGDEHRKICFPLQNKEQNKLAGISVCGLAHFEILSHDRDFGNVDAHEQSILTIKTECRPRLKRDLLKSSQSKNKNNNKNSNKIEKKRERKSFYRVNFWA